MAQPTVLSDLQQSERRKKLRYHRSTINRALRILDFWALVEEVPSGCWEWQGFRDKMGYGQYERSIKAHRFAYENTKGSIPSGMVVMHSCDNPPCVNPSHLSAGTKLDNSLDMAAKGRAGQTKLSPEIVTVIRSAASAGKRQADLAREYGVTAKHIWRIIHYRSHRKVVMPGGTANSS